MRGFFTNLESQNAWFLYHRNRTLQSLDDSWASVFNGRQYYDREELTGNSSLHDTPPLQRPWIYSVSQILKMGLANTQGDHIIAYVAALIDKDRAVLMVPAGEDGETPESIIKITRNTTVGYTSFKLDCSTLFLTQKVKVFGTTISTDHDPNLPNWSAFQLRACGVIPCGPTPPTIKTIGFAYKKVRGTLFPIISDETRNGFLVNKSNFPKNNGANQQGPAMGEMLIVHAYQLRKETTLVKLSDMDYYVSKPSEVDVFSSDIIALTGISSANIVDIRMCETKCRCTRYPTEDDYSFFVGRGTSSMAALEAYMRKDKVGSCTFQISAPIARNRAGVYTSKFRFPCNNKDEVSEIWASGATTLAEFFGTKRLKTPVEIRQIDFRDGEAIVIVNYSKVADDFLTAWCAAATSEDLVSYGPVEEFPDTAYLAIRRGFDELVENFRIFSQYVGTMTPIRPTEKLTEEQKRIGNVVLDEYQAEAMETILYSNGISLIQAPPGSGKTSLIAAATREMFLSKEARTVVFTGITNVSVDNALGTLAAISKDLEDFRPIRVASHKAMSQSRDIERNWSQSVKAMQFEQYISSREDKKVLRKLRRKLVELRIAAKRPASSAGLVVDRYVKVRLAEKVFEEMFIAMYKPNVIATTTALLLRHSGTDWCKSATHIFIDEASQLPSTELLAILAAFPNVKKVSIIGDIFQLKPHSKLPEESDATICFGTSDLIRLNYEYRGAAVKLKRIYRCHPLLTSNLLNSFYPYELEAGIGMDDRTMGRLLKLSRCGDGTPVRAYHVEGMEREGKNHTEADEIIKFVVKLLEKGVTLDQILILTYHRNQRSLLCSRLPDGIRVKTVDSAQGQQSPITIIATTKSVGSDTSRISRSFGRTFEFVSNPNRGTVALSRSLEATYIFGNLWQLETTVFWRAVIGGIRRINGVSGEPESRNNWNHFQSRNQ